MDQNVTINLSAFEAINDLETVICVLKCTPAEAVAKALHAYAPQLLERALRARQARKEYDVCKSVSGLLDSVG